MKTYLATLALLSCLLAGVSCEHTGAYSSPQYAKKMYPKPLDHNALLPKEGPAAQFKQQYEDIDRYDTENSTSLNARSTLLDTASSFLSGAGGQVMTSLAKDFIARSTGSSQVGFDCITQVLSLNLTNLMILVVLKALILAAGFFGAGAWKSGQQYGRSIDENSNASYMTEDEILLFLSYLAGQQTQDFGCLYRLACQKPKQAALYSSGAELLLQGTKLFSGNSIELDKYEDVAEGIKKAVSWGEEGMGCNLRYECGE